MKYVKIKNIFIDDGIKNQLEIKRDLNQRYGTVIDKMIQSWADILKTYDAWIEIKKGEPWFGNNGLLDIYVKVESISNIYNLSFTLQWNHTQFISSARNIEIAEWN